MTDGQHMQELAAYRFTVENLRERVAELEFQLAAVQQTIQAAVPKWIDDPHDIEQGQMLNPEWVKQQSAVAAHHGEGVPAQFGAGVAACIDKLNELHQEGTWNLKQSEALSEAIAALEALAATQPAAQGMDAQRWQIVRQHISGEYIAGHACFVVRIEPVHGANIMRGSVAQHFTKAVDDRAKQIKIAHQAWLAAQAKQGGAA